MNGSLRKGAVAGIALLFFLAPLKFTNPVILNLRGFLSEERWNLWGTWPNRIFYLLFLPLALVGLGGWKWTGEEKRMALLPGIFLLTQLLSASASLAPDLSRLALPLFFSLVAGYLLGARVIRSETDLRWLGIAWILGTLVVISYGISQGAGGLEDTRQYLRDHPGFAANLPELWKKVESDRIYSTFVNPNALGGYLAASVFIIAAWTTIAWKNLPQNFLKDQSDGEAPPPKALRGGPPAKAGKEPNLGKIVLFTFSFVLAALLLTCFWLTQSKGSYAALFLALITGAMFLSPKPKIAVAWAALIGLIAILGFAAGYGKKAVAKGEITWGQRTAYWRAAWMIGRDHPLLGAGPGAFSRLYPQYKREQDESTRLAHNNYLQMWCDSGLPGFLAFAAWLPGSLALWAWQWRKVSLKDRLVPTLWWCGCLVFAFHSLVDFDLYLISNSWPVFVILGHLTISKPLRQAQDL